MSCLGIIPAAGSGSRWGGYHKEMLPLQHGSLLIDRSVQAAIKGGASKVAVITNSQKISMHVQYLDRYPEVFYLTQKKKLDVYGAVYESLWFAEDYNFFAMPDTIFPRNTFCCSFSNSDLWFGYFNTDKPERFGVLDVDCIRDKDQSLIGTIQKAWGVVIWSEKVAKFWRTKAEIKTFDQALSMAMELFGYKTFLLGYFYDLATIEEYKKVINEDRYWLWK